MPRGICEPDPAVCEFEGCEEGAYIRGLCFDHDLRMTDYIAEQIMEQHRDDPL